MKQKHSGKYIFAPALIYLSMALNMPLVAQSADVQDIVKQWMGIEEVFIRGEPLYQLREKADIFYTSIETFRDSPMYLMYRFVPLERSSNFTIGPYSPREMNEVADTLALASAYREALEYGDREMAEHLSAQVNNALLHWLLLDAEMARFSGIGFFRLLLVFIVFITITTIVVLLLHKSLILSHEKEAESSFLTQALLFAQEEERGRISRELHDTIAQDLRGLSLGMERIGRTRDQAEREKLCDEAAGAHSRIITRVRDMCDYLVPPDFRFQGLPDALRRLCLDYKKRTGIDCRIEIMEDLNLTMLNEEKQLQVFRIIQEALTNVEKHARAKEAIVIMRSDAGGNIYIGVSDDGIGFSQSGDFNSGQHMGIRGMKKRAAILGGTLEIRSDTGEGTLVCLELCERNYDAKCTFN